MIGLRLNGRHYVSVILVMVALLLAACGSPEPTATPTAEPEATKAPAAATSPSAAASVTTPTKAATPADIPSPAATARPAIIIAPANTPIPRPTPTLDLVAIRSNLPPQIFIGTAKIDGKLAPLGTIVEALIGDESVGKGVVQANGKFTAVQVSFPGQTVTFTIGGFDTTQTALTEIGGGKMIDLTASSN